MRAPPPPPPHGDDVKGDGDVDSGGSDGAQAEWTAMRAKAAAAAATAHALTHAAVQQPVAHACGAPPLRDTPSRAAPTTPPVVQPPLRVSEALARAAARAAGRPDAWTAGRAAAWTSPRPGTPLHVLCACDTFKGTLAPDRVGEAAASGFRRACGNTTATSTDAAALPPVTSPPWSASDAQPLVPSLAAAAAASSSSSLASSAAAPPAVAFLHTPMSDGGAGLLDSVTYGTTTTMTASAAGGSHAGQEAGVDARDGLRLQRVYVPATVPITGPLGTPIEVRDDGAAATRPLSFACDVARRVLVVEMAEAAGLPRIARPQDRHPGHTTSYGVGELIRYAVAYITAHHPASLATSSPPSSDPRDGTGVRLFLGIGGSATNDGGLGALQALGLDIFVKASHAAAPADGDGVNSRSEATTEVRLERPLRGEDLASITRVAVSDDMRGLFPYLASASPQSSTSSQEPATATATAAATAVGGGGIAEVCLICDVDNPLVGPRGATYIFGPQKCAPPPASTSHNTSPHGDGIDAPPPPPPPGKEGEAEEEEAGEDAAVGAVTSAAQQHLLDALEAGMRHAAARVVASTWRALVSPDALAHLRADNDSGNHHHQPSPPQQTGAEEMSIEDGDEAAVRSMLLHRPGGGGAGGMSGFFRYLVRAAYAPGADVVGGLLGLYETPRVAALLGHTRPRGDGDGAGVEAAVQRPRGCLFHDCDVVVSGEGSFDAQTLQSHKTVGRLLEMCTAANGYRLWRHYGVERDGAEDGNSNGDGDGGGGGDGGCRCITDVVVVCGRCGFDDYAQCQSAVLETICSTLDPHRADPAQDDADVARLQVYLRALTQSAAFQRACGVRTPLSAGTDSAGARQLQEKAATVSADWTPREVLAAYCVPRVTLLPLTPTLFPVTCAVQQPFACVEAAMAALVQEAVRRRRIATAHGTVQP